MVVFRHPYGHFLSTVLSFFVYDILGTAYEGLGNLPEAIECYKQALSVDVFCEEALERLFQYQYLSPDDEKALLSQLSFKKQCSVEEEKFISQIYRQKMHHVVKQSDTNASKELLPLSTNADMLTNVAEKYFRNMNIDACYQLIVGIVDKDPYHDAALLLFIACCVQKSKVEELFSLAHRLVNYFPQKPLSWYCVACYYLSVKKHQEARKYLTKAITLNPNFPPAHLAFGISFASEGEHDQAITAFSTATRVMRGSHLPLMYLGKEYCLTGLMPTAVKFMKSALAMAPSDPVLLQEIGVMLANSGSYEKAEKNLLSAVSHLKVVDPHVTLQAWEPVFNNLGHVYRKVKKYDLALEMHHRALQLEPKQASTLTAIAFLHLLMGKYALAVEVANQSLRLKREDQFTLELLHYGLDEMFANPAGESESGNGTETLEDLESELLATDESFYSPTSLGDVNTAETLMAS